MITLGIYLFIGFALTFFGYVRMEYYGSKVTARDWKKSIPQMILWPFLVLLAIDVVAKQVAKERIAGTSRTLK